LMRYCLPARSNPSPAISLFSCGPVFTRGRERL